MVHLIYHYHTIIVAEVKLYGLYNINDACHFDVQNNDKTIDSAPDSNYSIIASAITEYAWITIPLYWVKLQFKVTSVHVYIRHKWGGSSWTSFKQIY